jgi:predicted secreted Zn-dependent protease
VQFDTVKSWKANNRELTDYLLKHEQGHLDIAHYHASKLATEMTSKQKITGNYENCNACTIALDERTKKMYDEWWEKTTEMNKKYDSAPETNHSMNTEKQEKWNQEIKKLLEEIK